MRYRYQTLLYRYNVLLILSRSSLPSRRFSSSALHGQADFVGRVTLCFLNFQFARSGQSCNSSNEKNHIFSLYQSASVCCFLKGCWKAPSPAWLKHIGVHNDGERNVAVENRRRTLVLSLLLLLHMTTISASAVAQAVALHHQPARCAAPEFSPAIAVHAADVFAHEFSAGHTEVPPPQLDIAHLTSARFCREN